MGSKTSVTNLRKVSKIKSKVNTGLAEAYNYRNKRITKEAVMVMKNPIITAIKRTLTINKKQDLRIKRDYKMAMVPAKIYETLDTVMQEKVWADLENEVAENVYSRMP